MLILNATLATMLPDADYGLILKGALVVLEGRIAWIGPKELIPDQYRTLEPVDLEGRLVTPGLIDCHTHIIHGGNRAREFELRLEGASYEALARAGGGIISTVQKTRQADENALLEGALKHVDALLAEGVTTIEIKSGYGLDIETELKMLRVARSIHHHRPIQVKTSFLGAHALPQEYADNKNAYIEEVCIPAMQAAHQEGLIDAVDGFCEGIAFNTAQIEVLFKQAEKLGLPIKLHAEQLSNSGGVQLAAKYHALSADHLEYANHEDAKAMAKAGSVAVMLPGAFYTLRETQCPPIEAFREQAVPMAVATDCNPGSSPLSSILLAMNMACTLFRLTPLEALQATTKNAAKALGLDECGTLTIGKWADLAVWEVDHPSELSYRIGYNALSNRAFRGVFHDHS